MLTNGRKPLVTLRDAATYITSLPKVEQQAPQWQLATEVLLLVAEHGGDTMMPRIAMMKALHRHEPRSESARAASGSKPTGLCDRPRESLLDHACRRRIFGE